MRRTALVIMLLAGFVPAAAWAAGAVVGDGTLSVRNGDGQIRVELDRGVMIGRFGAGQNVRGAVPATRAAAPLLGQIILVTPKDPECESPLVWDQGEQIVGEPKLGADKLTVDACVYEGEDLRFRLVGADAAAIRLQGDNISLSAVGRGRGWIKGRSEVRPDGLWSVNGGDYASLPDERQLFRLVAPPTND